MPETGSAIDILDISFDRENGSELKGVNETSLSGDSLPALGENEFFLFSPDKRPTRAIYKVIPYDSSVEVTNTGRIELTDNEYYGSTSFTIDLDISGPQMLEVTTYFADSTKSIAELPLFVNAIDTNHVPVQSFNIEGMSDTQKPISYILNNQIALQIEALPMDEVTLPIAVRIEVVKPDSTVEVFEQSYDSLTNAKLDIVTESFADQSGLYQVEISLANVYNVYGPVYKTLLLNVE